MTDAINYLLTIAVVAVYGWICYLVGVKVGERKKEESESD